MTRDPVPHGACSVRASGQAEPFEGVSWYLVFSCLFTIRPCSLEQLRNEHVGALVVKRKIFVSCPQALLNQLRAVFDQIIELQNTQDAIYRAALEELQRRLQFEEKKKQNEVEVWL